MKKVKNSCKICRKLLNILGNITHVLVVFVALTLGIIFGIIRILIDEIKTQERKK